ncbi:MAG TPA: 16S rRNA (guanine(527)-N(7))-methyltransferase RsmG [Bacilli bacterium]|nr:16S rRNA (guanine(527)-N(7))-methyltransferase RsmG [Bacilli bacterium]
MNNYLQEFKLSGNQEQQFLQYLQFLVTENEKINLTSIIEPNEVYIKHFYDSLSMSKFIPNLNSKNICDIGSGAGFPSIPLKILNPLLKVTIIEPTLKRVRFLNQLCDILNFQDVTVINGRAEDVIVNYREAFDVVVVRAVANLPIILELAIPFIKIEGSFIAYKGQAYSEELEASKGCLKTIEAKIKAVYNYELPNNLGARVLLEFTKSKATNIKYPRKYADIKNKTL